MANRHYAEIGDIWKHLPLTQILHAEQPAHYWESHAGSAVYTLELSPARDYGLVHFLRGGADNPLLRESVYYRLAARFIGNEPALYGASPALALAILGATEADFLFCDTDAESIMNIGMMAPKLEVKGQRCRLVHGDGIGALHAATRAAQDADLAETLAFLDPFDPLDSLEDGPHSMDLFCDLTQCGVQTLVWYGYGTEQEQQAFHRALVNELKARQLDPLTHNLWIGEMRLNRVSGFNGGFNPGVLGCGLVCTNLNPSSLARCTQLGRALEGIYTGVILPDGQPGDLQFTPASFGA